jgi:hypothetical protein
MFVKMKDEGSVNAWFDVTTTEATIIFGFADDCRLAAIVAPILGYPIKKGALGHQRKLTKLSCMKEGSSPSRGFKALNPGGCEGALGDQTRQKTPGTR